MVGGQPPLGRKHDDAPNPDLIALPVAWVKTRTGNTGKSARVFHTTMGRVEDFRNAGSRHLTVNAAPGCVELEEKIDPRSKVDIVGASNPPGTTVLHLMGLGHEKLTSATVGATHTARGSRNTRNN